MFDGSEDRIELDTNPLIDLNEFTIEAAVRIDKGGVSEQKIIHMQTAGDARILFEIEFVNEDEWFLENYIQTGSSEAEKVWLADTHKVHKADAWYHLALTYKDGVFTQYINGAFENVDTLTWIAPTDGVFSIGARQTKTGYMTGAFNQMLFSDSELKPSEFTINSELTTRQELWIYDNLSRIGGYDLQIFGDPMVIESEVGKAVEFDGNSDGIYVLGNPLLGTTEFTIETIIKPYDTYPANIEPRYIHFQDQNDDSRRITMEYRLTDDGKWYFDGFIKSPTDNLTLIDETLLHETDVWAHAAITYKNGTFKTFVNGEEELSGSVTYDAISADGIASSGMRMNEVKYMQGAIRAVLTTHKALSPAEFGLYASSDTSTTPPDDTTTPSSFASNQRLDTKVGVNGQQVLIYLNNDEQPINIICTNMQGQVIYNRDNIQFSASPYTIDAQQWSKGLYVIRIASGGKYYSQVLSVR